MKEYLNIYGIRSIIEAIDKKINIDKVWLLKSQKSTLFNHLFSLINTNKIAYSFIPKEGFEKFSKKNFQGAVARISPVKIFDFEKKLEEILENKKSPLIILLDGITDTRNFGAIIRTAAATNVDTIVVSTSNSAPINNDVIKTSAGGVFKTPISKVDNLKDAIYLLKSNNIDIIAITEKAKDLIYNYKLNKPVSIILGAEDKGISKGILKIIDNKVKIPMKKTADSLNVSVACGIALYEIIRQRQ